MGAIGLLNFKKYRVATVNQDCLVLAEERTCSSMEQKRKSRSRPTQICPADFLTNVQKQLYGGKAYFQVQC